MNELAEFVRVLPDRKLAVVIGWLDSTGECRVEYVDAACPDEAIEVVTAERVLFIQPAIAQERMGVTDDCDAIMIESSASVDVDANATVWIVQTPQQTLRLYFQAGMRPRAFVAELQGTELTAFLQGLAQLNFTAWKELYRPTGYEVYDGYAWTVRLFSDLRSVVLRGENAYPVELRSLYDLLQSAGVPRVWSEEQDGPWFEG